MRVTVLSIFAPRPTCGRSSIPASSPKNRGIADRIVETTTTPGGRIPLKKVPRPEVEPPEDARTSTFTFVSFCSREYAMPSRSLQKQVSMFLPLGDWRLIRNEAARQHIPITELCRRWMRPGLQALRAEGSSVSPSFRNDAA
jgi:hypothetical protein